MRYDASTPSLAPCSVLSIRSSERIFDVSFPAAPSTPTPTGMFALRYSVILAIPAPLEFADGHEAIDVFVFFSVSCLGTSVIYYVVIIYNNTFTSYGKRCSSRV